MAANILWCLLGCLVLTSLVTAGKPSDPDDDRDRNDPDVICESYTVKHEGKGRPPEEVDIEDDNGRPADITKVTLKEEFSKNRCTEDESYEVDESKLIVSKGCHARFRVCYRSNKGDDPTVSKNCKLVRILSRIHRRTTKPQKYKILTMKIKRKLSGDRTCDRDDYGFRDKIAFAEKGCRADFEICFKDKPDDDDDTVCRTVYLKSTRSKDDERVIKDDEGDSVTIVSIDPVDGHVNDLCKHRRTYTYEDSTVTAKDGCVGRFKVCYLSNDIEATLSTGCIRVRLLSHDDVDNRKKLTSGDGKIKSMQLKKQFGGTACIKNKNYGIDKDSVFANNGCRGEFLVCVLGLELVTDKPESTCINLFVGVRNGSDRRSLTRDDGRPARIESVRLLRQDSTQDCILRQTFDRTSSQVITSGGCRGTFRVCYT